VVLVAIAFLLWEVGRLLNYNVQLGEFTPGMVSAVLALVLLVFTVIVFLDWSDFRSWPEWVGLVLAIAIGVASFVRAKAEGVEVPKMPAKVAVGGSGSGGAAASSGGGAPAPENPAPVEDAGSPDSSEA
jgi:protein-S-isoprenylcysteine O-methyltransferase Ste14